MQHPGHATYPEPSVHDLTVTRTMPQPIAAVYRAWTTGWASWRAEADTMRVDPTVGAPFFFDVLETFEDDRPNVRHPHYGRFVELVPNELVSLTWVTGTSGTGGAETTVTVRLTPEHAGTVVTLTHARFRTSEVRDQHATAWSMILAHQEARLLMLARDASSPSTSREALRSNRSIPDASLIPVRSYPDLDAAVAWLCDALGCRERLRIPGHRVQLTVGNGAVVAVAWDPALAPSNGGRPPATLMLRVSDIDAVYVRALSLGATALSAPADQPFGERQATLRDPAGHSWTLTQTIADVDPASWGGEIAR